MSKKYSIVETSKMAMEYDGSLINVELRASVDLENGILVAVENKKVRPAKPSDTEVFLHASVEKMYDESLGLGDFIVEEGELCRTIGMRKFDEFKTSAILGEIKEKDKVTIADDGTGRLVKVAVLKGDESFLGEVIEVGKLGFRSASFGINDSQVAGVIKVLKA